MIEKYQKWRLVLKPDDIKKIYIIKLTDRYKYYANNEIDIRNIQSHINALTIQNNQILKHS